MITKIEDGKYMVLSSDKKRKKKQKRMYGSLQQDDFL